MTTGGWFIMIGSLTFVTIFFAGTLYMVFRQRSRIGRLHSTYDKTPDMNDES